MVSPTNAVPVIDCDRNIQPKTTAVSGLNKPSEATVNGNLNLTPLGPNSAI